MSPTRRSRVLVVDDDAAIRQFAMLVLGHEGYEVEDAADGPQALRLVAERKRFDLFVLDVMMPQMHGDELARQIRQRDADAKILYFTGNSDRLFESRHSLSENEAIIDKPATLNGLLEAVARMLTGKYRRPLNGRRSR